MEEKMKKKNNRECKKKIVKRDDWKKKYKNR